MAVSRSNILMPTIETAGDRGVRFSSCAQTRYLSEIKSAYTDGLIRRELVSEECARRGGVRLVEQAQHCEVDLGTAMVASRIDQSADLVASQYVAPQRSLWRSTGVGRYGNRFGRSAARPNLSFETSGHGTGCSRRRARDTRPIALSGAARSARVG